MKVNEKRIWYQNKVKNNKVWKDILNYTFELFSFAGSINIYIYIWQLNSYLIT